MKWSTVYQTTASFAGWVSYSYMLHIKALATQRLKNGFCTIKLYNSVLQVQFTIFVVVKKEKKWLWKCRKERRKVHMQN